MKPLVLKDKSNVHCMAMSPDGRKLAVGQHRKDGAPTITIWDTSNWKYIDGFAPESGESVKSLSFNRHSNKLAFVTYTPGAGVIDLDTKEITGIEIEHPTTVQYARHKDLLLIAGLNVTVLDATDHKEVFRYDLPEPGRDPLTFATQPIVAVFREKDTKVMFTGVNDDKFYYYDIASSKLIEQFPEGSPRAALMITDESEKYLCLVSFEPGGEQIWTLPDMTRVVPEYFAGDGRPADSACFHPTANTIAFGTGVGKVSLRELKDGSFLFIEKIHTGAVSAVTFTKDGNYILSTSVAGKVLFTDISEMIK
jgi:WD40 repeat protein